MRFSIFRLFILFPLFHAVIMLLHIKKYGFLAGDIYDWAWNALFVFLGFLSLFSPIKFLKNTIVLTLSTLLSIFLCDRIIAGILPSGATGAPWLPIKRVSTASDTMPGIQGQIKLSVNRYGLRGPETILEDNDLNILCVGGSTTECLYVSDENTWPWRLQNKLEVELEKKVFVGNAGVSGHYSPNHEYLIKNYSFSPKFSWIVVLCGINDMGRALKGDDEFMRNDFVKSTLNEKYASKGMPWYKRFEFMKLLKMGHVEPRTDEIIQDEAGNWYKDIRLRRKKALKHETISIPPKNLNQALSQYRIDLKSIVKAAKENGQKLLFLSQPTLYAKGMSNELEKLLIQHISETQAHSPEVLADTMDAFNQTLSNFCRDEGIAFFDLDKHLPKDKTVFYDDCHFNTSGCVKVANLVFSELIKHIRTQEEGGSI